MKFLLGEKIEMTQLWQGDQVVPVTKVVAGPCTVIQLKKEQPDGYKAVQVGFGSKKEKNLSKALRGHFKDLGSFRYVREFRVSEKEDLGELKAGDRIGVATFAPGDRLTVTGVSKGKGFQGVVKRHGFHGQDKTHGNKDQLRASGSVGAGGVQHVFKGTRMAGRMGGDRVTLHDVEVVAVDEAANTLFVKGALPGARHSLVLLSADGELKLYSETAPVVEETKSEEAAEETTVAEDTKTEETPVEEVKEEVAVEEPKKEEEVVVAEAPVEEVRVEEEPKAEEKTEETVAAEEPKTEAVAEAPAEEPKKEEATA